jgi:hypothetical protein
MSCFGRSGFDKQVNRADSMGVKRIHFAIRE